MSEYCPACGNPAISRCKCMLGDRQCKFGHEWFTCGVHKKVVMGKADHSKGTNTCQCSKKEYTLEILVPGKLPDETLMGECLHCGCAVRCDIGDQGVVAKVVHPNQLSQYSLKWCPTKGCGYSIDLMPTTEFLKRKDLKSNEKSV